MLGSMLYLLVANVDMSWAQRLPMLLAGEWIGAPFLAGQLHVIEAVVVDNWRLLVAMLHLRSVSRSPASIREGPMANVGHPFRKVIHSPSPAQLSACLRKCKFRRNRYGTARASIQSVAVANLLALSVSANIVTKASSETAQVGAFLSQRKPGSKGSRVLQGVQSFEGH